MRSHHERTHNYLIFRRNEQFSDSDITVNSVEKAGINTNASIVVNEPGSDNPVPFNIVRDALYQSIQEHDTTSITGLQLALFMELEVSIIQRTNAINISLTNTQANEVSYLFTFFENSVKNISVG